MFDKVKKFKVGDKVKIRKDLKGEVLYGGYYAAYGMVKYAGKEYTVIEIIDDGPCGVGYKLDNENRWNWPDEMLEKVETGGNEMTAKEYLEIKKRMLGAKIDVRFEDVHPEQTIEIVQKWGEEHPVKTLKDVLLEKFPDAPLMVDGTPKFCPELIGLSKNKVCEGMNCVECWGRQYIDEFEEWLNA